MCEGKDARDVLDEQDNMCVYAAHAGVSPVCGGGVAACCRSRTSVYWREHLHRQIAINQGCCKTKLLGQDSDGEKRKNGIIGQNYN